MKVRVGILGLPNVGKSTLFNALAQKSLAQAANFPFCTIEPNIAPIAVPDEHLGERLRALAGLERTVPATIEWVDIAGLAKGASRGEGLGNKFLGTARDCDAICHVVRIFEDPDTIHVEGRVDPAADAEVVNLELLLADLAHAERRLEKASCRGEEREALEAVVSCLQRGEPARAAGLSEGARLSIKSMGTPEWGSNHHQQSAVAGALPQLSVPGPVCRDRPAHSQAGALRVQRGRGRLHPGSAGGTRGGGGRAGAHSAPRPQHRRPRPRQRCPDRGLEPQTCRFRLARRCSRRRVDPRGSLAGRRPATHAVGPPRIGTAKLEAEVAAKGGEQEEAAYLAALGAEAGAAGGPPLSHTALPAAVRRLLGLGLVYTGPGVPKENTGTVRAHLIRSGGLTAEGLAGRLHGDILRGFVCAEVAPATELLQHASYSQAKDSGCVRTEGRGYVLAADDVVVVKWKS